jgi:hypothetical protein
MTTADFSIVAEPLQSDQALKERPRVATEQSLLSRPKVEAEPETRLWKVCAEATSPTTQPIRMDCDPLSSQPRRS